ncbi:MAG: hypothetical protein AAFP17_08370 [Pseudomonadota bacterium]
MIALEQAVRRLSAAVELAETRAAAAAARGADGTASGMTGDLFEDDRDALKARIRALEEQAAEDAALRVEAAAAVKAALADLKAAHSDGGDTGAPEHA